MTPQQKNKKFTFILTSQNGQSEFSSEWLEAPIIFKSIFGSVAVGSRGTRFSENSTL